MIGNGAVYLVDASGVTYSDVAEGTASAIPSIYDIKLHVLSEGQAFDLTTRRPADAHKHHLTRT